MMYRVLFEEVRTPMVERESPSIAKTALSRWSRMS